MVHVRKVLHLLLREPDTKAPLNVNIHCSHVSMYQTFMFLTLPSNQSCQNPVTAGTPSFSIKANSTTRKNISEDINLLHHQTRLPFTDNKNRTVTRSYTMTSIPQAKRP
ncbi:MAG: hypothetical protein FRX48_04845 [Lasallia pustulata]|uniref:Uncharacterized protein n=1 Tax=Lasallia pustulata TaxID=136370 RepID=A0A5M8PRI0_9LECA|nr:MAG: hypothetical protein FRX48_04845 [Lasallia pustulata]